MPSWQARPQPTAPRTRMGPAPGHPGAGSLSKRVEDRQSSVPHWSQVDTAMPDRPEADAVVSVLVSFTTIQPGSAASQQPAPPQLRTGTDSGGRHRGELESVLGATPHEFESRILRTCPPGQTRGPDRTAVGAFVVPVAILAGFRARSMARASANATATFSLLRAAHLSLHQLLGAGPTSCARTPAGLCRGESRSPRRRPSRCSRMGTKARPRAVATGSGLPPTRPTPGAWH